MSQHLQILYTYKEDNIKANVYGNTLKWKCEIFAPMTQNF